MSRKAKVLLVTEADSNVDFLEQGITSRYKLLDRGRTYSIENAFKKIEEESPLHAKGKGRRRVDKRESGETAPCRH